jgi:Domain of unknown function (DUF5679)
MTVLTPVSIAGGSLVLGRSASVSWPAEREYARRIMDPTPAPTPEPQGRCVCGEKVTIADAREITLPNGRPGWEGYCPVCGAPLFAIRRRVPTSS